MPVVEEGSPLVDDVERSAEQEQPNAAVVASRRRVVGIGAVGTLVVFAIVGAALATSRSAAEKADTSNAIDMAMINTGNCLTGMMCMAAAKKDTKDGVTFCCPPNLPSLSTSDSGGAVSCSCSAGGAFGGGDEDEDEDGDEDEDEDGGASYSAVPAPAPMAQAVPGGAAVPPNVMPGNCMVGAQCQGPNVGKTGSKNGIFFCCPLGMTGMSTGDSNGMVTCTCS